MVCMHVCVCMYMEGPKSKVLVEPWHGEGGGGGGVEGEGGGLED